MATDDALLAAYFAVLLVALLYLVALRWLGKRNKTSVENPLNAEQRRNSAVNEDGTLYFDEETMDVEGEITLGDYYAQESVRRVQTRIASGRAYQSVDRNEGVNNPEEMRGLRAWWRRSKLRTNCVNHGVMGEVCMPVSILIISFLNSFVQSFPINFFGKFITSEIGMTPAQFQQYYAFIFLPFSFKPIYAYIFERFTFCGSGRAAYIVFCNLMISVTMFLMATITTEVWHVFLIGFVQNFFEAAAGMVVGLVIIDVASKDKSKIPKLQAEQTIARYLGTFSALLLALPVSGCFSYKWDNRTALLASACIPLVAALFGLCVPSTDLERVSGHAAPRRASSPSTDENADQASGGSRTALERKALYMFVPTIVLFEVLAICIGIKGNLEAAGLMDLWRIIVISAAAVLIAYILGCIAVLLRMGDSPAVRLLVHISIPCIYLFLVDAVPTSLEAMSWYKYHLFTNQCELQGLSIVSILSQIGGMAAFGVIFVGYPVEMCLLLTTMFSATAGLLETFKTRESSVLSPFGMWAVIDVFTSIFSAMFLLGKETLATYFSFTLEKTADTVPESEEPTFHDSVGDLGQEQVPMREPSGPAKGKKALFSPGILYSIYLTCFDIGGSASGFLSAAIISTLGITSSDFSALNTLIYLCSIAFLSTFILLPTIRYARLGDNPVKARS